MMKPVVDQYLFGYRDGHEPLAGSRELTPAVWSRLLPHTDASFDEFAGQQLVGTVVDGLDRFALVRIWPAPEMPRPGAVWGHVLLIDFETLGRIDPVVLMPLFRRPGPSDDFSTYRRRLTVDSPPAQVDVSEQLLIAVIWSAYGSPAGPSLILWPDLGQGEHALLAVWRQQSPKQRQAFSFRTRGRARPGTSAYHVQVAATVAGRTRGEGPVVLDAQRVQAGDAPLWVTTLAAEAAGTDSGLSVALARFGHELTSPRELAEVWPAIMAADISRVMDYLRQNSSPDRPLREIKGALFGKAGLQQVWQVSEVDRLFALATGNQSESELHALEFRGRLSALSLKQRPSALRLLRHARSPAREIAVQVIAPGLTMREVALLSQDHDLAGLVFCERPAVLKDPGFWRVADPTAAPILFEHASAHLETRELVTTLTRAGAQRWLPLAVDLSAISSVDALKAMARLNPDLNLARATISQEGDEVTEWIRCGRRPAKELLIAASALPIDAARRVPLGRWLPAAQLSHDRHDSLAICGAITMLALALHSPGQDARRVVAETFGPVHRTVAADRVPAEGEEALALIVDAAPSSRASLLRKALVSRTRHEKWSHRELARTLDGAGPDGQEILSIVGKKHPLRKAFERVVGGITDALR